MRDGRIVEQGSYSELSQNQNSVFSKFLAVLEETGLAPNSIPDLAAAMSDEAE